MPDPTFLRITTIQVKGLFGYYNHVINLNTEERVTILHGPNGVGKTKLLQMVSWLLGDKLKNFNEIPFDSFEVGFSNEARIWIAQDVRREKYSVYLFESQGGLHRAVLPANSMGFSIIEQIFDDKRWASPPWLAKFCGQVHCLFIETQRLLRFEYPEDGGQTKELFQRVEDAARDLARKFSDTMARYGRESQALDQSYPQRVLAKTKGPTALDAQELKLRLDDLEHRQNDLKELGLLDQASTAQPDLPDLAALNATELRAMTLYVTDTEKKLSVLKDFAQRIRLLLKVSPKFLHKRIRLDREKGLVAENDRGQPLSLDALSSGEQHELVLHFDLLFGVKPNTLVLVDEPELSLHVVWQKQFLPNLLEIAKTVGIDVLVATHSPFIIGDRSDLMVALEGDASDGS